MEDSFGDFQEKKKINTGPKVVPRGKKNNQKKSLKRSKGQKDIRSLIKNNELVSYSQDFDQVCKQSGVDVDAEQLQLAIALSKSLNDVQSPSEDVEIQNKQLSSQERSAKIRTTLQEYGFRVNNTKISLSLSTNKRKKYKKPSKLLQISNEERKQKISNKYSEVLASNISKSPNKDPKCIYLKDTIFYKATNFPYENIRNIESFYVSNLIDQATHNTCLLRDWSEIPGRPVSPKPRHNNFNFEAIQCSQDELDNILSGSVDTAHNIVNSKLYLNEKLSLHADPSKDHSYIKYNDKIDIIEPIPSCSNISRTYTETEMSEIDEVTAVQIDDIQDKEKCDSLKHTIQGNIECVDLLIDESFIDNCSRKSSKNINSYNLNSRQLRNASPDLFDDDLCSIIDDKNDYSTIETNEACSIIVNKNYNSTTDTNEECFILQDKNNYSTLETIDVCSIVEDKNSFSTIKTNEVCSKIEDKNYNNTIDTNAACSIAENKNDNAIDTNEVGSIVEDKNYNSTRESISKYDNCGTIIMDLTECVNYIGNNPNIHNTDITKRKSNDLMDITECLIVNSKNNNNLGILGSSEDNKVEENVEIVDLTQGPNLVYNFQEIERSGTQKFISLEVDDTIIYDDVVFKKTVNESTNLQEPIVLCDEVRISKDDVNYKKYSKYDKVNNSNQNSFISDDEKDRRSKKIVLNFLDNYEFKDKNDDEINIDLTQGLEQSEGNYSFNTNPHPEFNYDDCGLETVKHNSGTSNNDKDNDIISLKSVLFDNNNENHDEDIDLTQDSEKSETTEENYAINGPGTSYNNLENFDHNVGTTDNNSISILSVDNVTVNSEENNEDDKIDLTQITEDIKEKTNTTGYSYIAHKNNSKLGKIDNISIDYDEMFDEISSEFTNVSKHTFKSNTSEKDDVNASNPSINSEVFEISDKELNYSIHHSIHENVNIGSENSRRVILNRSLNDSYVPTVNLVKPLTPIKEKINSQPNTPIKINIGDAIIKTPKNNEYIIKTRDVTPKADYESMTTPERNKELERYGLKPFKRKRAIQLLTFVYDQTHPIIQSCSPGEGPSKRLKRDNKYSSQKNKSKSPKKCLDFGSDVNKENDIFIVTKETPDIKNIECDPKEWMFQNREKAKVHSCRVPLHIAFHNYVSCRRLLKEAILRYEPVNIDTIHKDLVSYGHKYNPKDLLKFMDRKCITVKTVENNMRNKNK